MVLTYRTGAAGAPSSAKAMMEHLSTETDVPELAERLAAYLGQSFEPAAPGMTAALPKRDMHPLVADVLGIDVGRALRPDEVTNLLAGRRTDGKAIPGKEIQRSTKDKVRLAYTDFTFSAPKSFSVALVMAPTEAERAILETCWLEANAALVDHIAEQIGGARQGRGGKGGVVPGHMAVMHFNHYTSRPTVKVAHGADTELITVPTQVAADMQRHTHNVFLHVTVTDDGRVRSPNLDETRDRLHEWGAIGHAFLATRLRAAGVRAEIDPKTGLSCLPDVPQSACELFQNRTDDGEAYARKHAASQGLDWDALDQKARIRLLKGGTKASRKAKTDGMADYAAWLKTAADAGYEHKSVLDPERKQALAPPEERARVAYEASLPLFDPEWMRRSKLEGSVPRIMAARGYIAAGIESPADLDAVLEAYKTEGVRHDGVMTPLIWAHENEKRFASVTTGLHVDQEREAIGLLKLAAADKSAALTTDQIKAAVQRVAASKGYDFTNEHGRKQRPLIDALATAGRAAVAVGAAGVGKTTLLEPVIDAYHAAGWQSFGVTLAWRQTHGLVDAGVGKRKKAFNLEPDTEQLTTAGIDQTRAFAMVPFLKAADEGRLTLNDKTLVVVDEIATIGTRQILDLARLQAKHGFKLVGLGDDKQCQSIEAGATIDLFRRALGNNQVPELLDTIRQRRKEDQDVAKLFRKGKAGEALKRKEKSGLLALVPGGYGDAIKAGVDEWERRSVAGAERERYSIGITVPTNADAHAVGLEIRTRQRAAGKLLGEDWQIGAVDQRGVESDLPLAIGDKVRLFDRVNASFGQGARGYFGENGTVAEVVTIDTENGLRLKRSDGKVGAIKWKSLQDKSTKRIRLAYGHALTVDARQGDTLTDHITIMPAGTKGVNAFKMYPADTRNREDSVLIVSHGAEKEEVRNRRPMGDPWLAEASEAEMRTAVMDNMARNLSRQPAKTLAVDLLDTAMDVQRGGVNTQQAAWFRKEQAAEKGSTPDLSTVFTQNKEETAVVSLLAAMKRSTIAIGHTALLMLTDESGAAPRTRKGPSPKPPRPKRTRRQERPVQYVDARAEFAEALRHAGLSLKGEPQMDGKWHRAKAEGDKGLKQSARYRGYLDSRPAGFIENFKTGYAKPWKASGQMPELTAAERQRTQEAKVARESERRAEEDKAAKKAFAIWSKGKAVKHYDNAYLSRKGVHAYSIRQDRSGNLIVPLQDANGFIRNIQTISPKGEKLFLQNGRKHGLFAQLGVIDPASPLLIAEGYATAASLHEATGLPVIVAFDSGNLLPVAQAIRAKHQMLQIVLAGDNDHQLPRREKPLPNVGKEKAEAAAKAVGGVAITPVFDEGDPRTDWNDIAEMNGKIWLQNTFEAELTAKGITMPERKTEATRPMPTAQEREAARQAGPASPPMTQNQAQQDAIRQREQQRQQERRHNHGPSL